MGRKKKFISEQEISKSPVSVMETTAEYGVKVTRHTPNIPEVIEYPNAITSEQIYKGNIEDFIPKHIETIAIESKPIEQSLTKRVIVGNPQGISSLGGRHFQIF